MVFVSDRGVALNNKIFLKKGGRTKAFFSWSMFGKALNYYMNKPSNTEVQIQKRTETFNFMVNKKLKAYKRQKSKQN